MKLLSEAHQELQMNFTYTNRQPIYEGGPRPKIIVEKRVDAGDEDFAAQAAATAEEEVKDKNVTPLFISLSSTKGCFVKLTVSMVEGGKSKSQKKRKN